MPLAVKKLILWAAIDVGASAIVISHRGWLIKMWMSFTQLGHSTTIILRSTAHRSSPPGVGDRSFTRTAAFNNR